MGSGFCPGLKTKIAIFLQLVKCWFVTPVNWKNILLNIRKIQSNWWYLCWNSISTMELGKKKLFWQKKFFMWFHGKIGTSLLHSVDISGFFCHSDFTWNQFWWFKKLKICHFLQFYGLWILLIWYISTFKKCKNSVKSNFRGSKCVKMSFFELL